jgi:hypothetical protein
MQAFLSTVLSEEDLGHHWVTCVTNQWGFVSSLRGTLHPMVVIFEPFMPRFAVDAKTCTYDIMRREEADLKRHRFIQLHAGIGERPEHVPALYERLGVRYLRMPFELDTLLALVTELAQEIEAASHATASHRN